MNGGGRKKAPDQTNHPSRASGAFFSRLRVEKRREGRERFVEPNPLLLFGFGRKKSVGYAVPVCERECTFSADDDDDEGSWSFGSVALFVADPIWRFWRFPSETVIMASGWIVGQMSGTASLPLSLSSSFRRFEWSVNNAFFSFCVGWLSIIFGTLHNNGQSNERALTDPPPCPLRLVARQIAPSPACLSLPSSTMGSGSAFFISWVTSVSPEAAARAARRQAPIPSR